MMKRKASLFYLLLMLLLALPLPVQGWSGKVIGVDAGDTITVLRDEQPVRVRLYGIDSPDEGQPFGAEAKQFTSTMVFGKMVEV
ncbi:MAG: nuclease, partial [Deltaproteobacteria bacterium]|nr:nuclease [Deltaproteobacteria bacterium]